jgi:hypothetical protein
MNAQIAKQIVTNEKRKKMNKSIFALWAALTRVMSKVGGEPNQKKTDCDQRNEDEQEHFALLLL